MVDDTDPEPAPQVVLVEDDPLVRFGQELLLQDWGYRVVAGESEEAIEAALQGCADDVAAIIADYNVNGPNSGAEIARTISEQANRTIPTLLMSASLGRASGATAEKYGFAFLAKPVDPEELRAWLAGVISREARR